MYAQMTLDFTGGPGTPGPAPLQPAAWRPVEELADVLAGTWFLCHEDEVRSAVLPLALEGYDLFLRALYGRDSFLWLNPAGSASVLAGTGGGAVRFGRSETVWTGEGRRRRLVSGPFRESSWRLERGAFRPARACFLPVEDAVVLPAEAPAFLKRFLGRAVYGDFYGRDGLLRQVLSVPFVLEAVEGGADGLRLAGSGGAGVEVRAVRQLRVQGYGDHACLHLDAWGTSGAYMGFALTVGIPPDLQRFRAVARDAGRRRMR